MLRIGVTGGIGSGKTYVCRMLQEMGLAVYDCDSEAKRIMETDEAVIQGLRNLVGESVYTADWKIDKPVMASYLFACKEHADAVSAIVHPAVGRGFQDFVRLHANAAGCVMESAILVESGLTSEVDVTVCVQAPLEVRLQRVQARDGMSEEEVRRRIARQMAEEEQKAYPFDYVVRNDGQAELGPQLREMLRRFKLF